MDDSVVVFALSRRCTVLSGKRGFYKDYPAVEDGRRLFRVKDIKSLGSSLRFGSSVFSVSYKGQTPTCHKCGSEEHFARECEARKACFRCGSQEHEVRECDKGIKCDACHEFGHPFFKCPSSYANRVQMTSNWMQFEHDATDKECFDAAVGDRQNIEVGGSGPVSGHTSQDELTQLKLGTLSEPGDLSAVTNSEGENQRTLKPPGSGGDNSEPDQPLNVDKPPAGGNNGKSHSRSSRATAQKQDGKPLGGKLSDGKPSDSKPSGKKPSKKM